MQLGQIRETNEGPSARGSISPRPNGTNQESTTFSLVKTTSSKFTQFPKAVDTNDPLSTHTEDKEPINMQNWRLFARRGSRLDDVRKFIKGCGAYPLQIQNLLREFETICSQKQQQVTADPTTAVKTCQRSVKGNEMQADLDWQKHLETRLPSTTSASDRACTYDEAVQKLTKLQEDNREWYDGYNGIFYYKSWEEIAENGFLTLASNHHSFSPSLSLCPKKDARRLKYQNEIYRKIEEIASSKELDTPAATDPSIQEIIDNFRETAEMLSPEDLKTLAATHPSIQEIFDKYTTDLENIRKENLRENQEIKERNEEKLLKIAKDITGYPWTMVEIGNLDDTSFTQHDQGTVGTNVGGR